MKTLPIVVVSLVWSFVASLSASAQILPPEARAIVPVVGSNAGAFGAQFRTELQLHNAGNETIRGTLVFRAAGRAGSATDPSLGYEIGPHETIYYENVVEQMGTTGLGSMDIIPETGSKLPTAVFRAFDDKGEDGTAGATVPMVLVTKALTSGKSAALVVPSNLERFRFNIGVRSLREGATIHVVVYEPDGTVAHDLGERSYPGDFFTQSSVNQFLGVAPGEGQTVELTVVEGRAIVYATVTDNRTNDGSFQLDEIFNSPPTVADADGDGVFLVVAQTTAGQPVTISATVSDEDGDAITYALGSAPAHGAVGEIVATETGFTIVYTPEPGFLGEDELTITIGDGEDAITLTVRIIVTEPGNGIPTANSGQATTMAGMPVTITLSGADPDGDDLVFLIRSGPSNGTLSSITAIDGTSARVTYTPNGSFGGTDSFEFSVDDGRGGVVRATVTITVIAPVNRAPVATDQTVSMALDTPASFTLLASDPDGDPLGYTITSGPSSGTLSGTAPNLTYTPNAGFSGNDSFNWSVSDGRGGTDSATVTLVVSASGNVPPVASNGSATTPEDTPVGIMLAASDADGDPLSYTITSGPSNGTLSGTAPSLTYTPSPNFNGTDSFTFTASDASTPSNTATFTITVTPVNDPPVAVADAYGTSEDTALSIAAPGVLGNDTDVDGDALSSSVRTLPTNGALGLNTNGSFTYTPNPNFNGTDNFSYNVSDGNGGNGSATVTITVTAVNDPPFASGDAYVVDEGATLVIAAPGVLGNDTDVEGNPLTAALVSTTTNGALTLNADGSFTYIHDGNETTSDSFTYRASDGVASSNTATVAITVNPVSDAPAIDLDADDSGGTTGTGYAVTFTENDPATLLEDPADAIITDSDGGTLASLTVTLTNLLDAGAELLDANLGATPIAKNYDTTTNPGVGALTLTGPATLAEYESVLRTVTYRNTSEAPDTTPRVITFVANDGTNDSAAAISTVTIVAANDAPVANDATFNVDENSANGTAVGTVTASDVDGDTLSYAITGGTGMTAFAINASTGVITVADTAQLDFETTTSFTLTVTVTDDGTGTLSDTAAITINLNDLNEAPVADDQSVTTDEDLAVVITLTGSDVDGDPLTFAIGTGPTNGSLGAITPIDASSAQVTYTPNADFNGSDSFTFTSNDGTLTSAAATVSITVDPVNDAPAAVDQAVTTDEDVAVVITLTGSDVDGDTLTFAIGTGPTNGSLGAITPIDATSAQVTYTPNGNFNGADSFTFTVNDGTVTSAAGTVSITVDPVNDAPAADAQAQTTNEDTPLVITLTGSDVDGDPLTFAIATGPTNGSLGAITPIDGTSAQVTYTPNADFNGADSFTFTANDGTATSVAATVSITVDPVNDTPVADAQAVTTDEEVAVVITLTGSDGDGDSLTFAIGTGPTNGSLSAITPIDATSAQVTYTPNGNFNGADSFTFTANDGTLTSPTATVSITVDPVNDAPVANAQAVTTDEDTPLIITLTGSDIDGDSLTFAIASGPTNGSLGAITPITATSAQVTYTPSANFNGADSFTFTVNDGTVTSPAATVSITVNAVNDTPVANAQAVTTDEEVPVVITLTGSDGDGDSLTFAIATGPANGSLSAITPIDGTSAQVTYTPNADFDGADSFTFTVNDGTSTSPAATVSITVNGVNDAPVANAQAVTTDEDVAVVITLTGTDVDGDSLTFAISTGPTNGSLGAITPITATSAQVTYTPNANFNGADSFTFTVNDGTSTSPAATVSITVNAVNDPPTANPDTADITEEAPNVAALNQVSGNVLTNDTDVDSTLTVSAVAGGTVGNPRAGTYGSVTINSDGSYTYTLDDTNPTVNALAPGQMLSDAFNYTASDGEFTSSSSLTVTIHGADDPPMPDDDAFDFLGNTELRVDLAAATTPHALETTAPDGIDGVLEGDVDPDGGPAITVSGIVGCGDVTAPFDCVIAGQGTVSLDADGSFSFLPVAGDADPTATFQYTLTGNALNAGTVTLTRFERVWYVRNDATAGGTGTSTSPFDTLVEAQTASVANDTIFVYRGNGSASGQDAGISLKSGQRLLGEHVGLSLPVSLNGNGSPTVLRAASPGNHAVLADTVAGGPEGVSAIDVIPTEIAGLSLSGNVNAIEWTSNAAFAGTGALEIHENVITGSGVNGIDINLAGTGATQLSIHDNTVTATGTGINVQETGTGALTITAFADLVVTAATGGSGIVINNAIFDATPGGSFEQVSGGVAAIGVSGDGVGGSGLTLTNIAGDLAFTDLDIFASNGSGLLVSGTGAVNTGAGTGTRVTVPAGVAIIETTGGPAVSLSNMTADLQLTRLRSTSTTTSGVSLTNVSDGTTSAVFSAGSGSTITTTAGATGPIFNVSGGNADIAYAGTIVNSSTNARAVSLTTWTGDDGTDDITLSGAITESGLGILVNGNSGTRPITFSGGMTINTTTGEGLAATSNTNSGGLHVTGTNTISATSATALRIAGTTIGSSNVTFRSISSGNATAAADPVNGIVLNSTGSTGRLIVTGNGGVCSSAASCSGGALQNTTGDGISLISTSNPSFINLYVGGSLGHGINVSGGSNGMSLTGCYVQNSGNADNEYGLNISNMTGTVSIIGTAFDNAFDNLVYVTNSGGLTFNVSGSSVFTYPVTISALANSAILLEPSGSGAITASITGSTFTNIKSASAQIGSNTLNANGVHSFTFSNNVINSNTGGATGRAGGVNISGQELTTTNITIANNNFTGAGGNGVISIDTNDTSIVAGTVSGNTISAPPGVGMFVAVDEAGENRLTLTGNTITNSGGDGIQIVNFGGVGVSDMYIAVTNNQVNGHSLNTSVNFVGGISITSFEDTSCIELKGNSVTGTPAGPTHCGGIPCVDYYLEELGGTTTFEEVPNTADTTLNAAYVNATNDAGPVTIFGIIDLTNGAQCLFP